MPKAKAKPADEIDLSKIKPNPKNPRTIKTYDFEQFVEKLKRFPKMLKYRPIVVDKNGMIIGGDKRYRALQAIGYKTVPKDWIRNADDLTPAEREEFIIADNVPAGDWDWDMLANEWDEKDLLKFGLKVPVIASEDAAVPDAKEQWENMPEFDHTDKTAFRTVIVHIKDEKHVKKFFATMKQKYTDKTKMIWFPELKIESYANKKYK